MTEANVADTPPGLPFTMPWVASVPSLEQMDKRLVLLAVESARTVQSKAQLWRYIEEVGIAPLLAALKKGLGASADAGAEGEEEAAGGGADGNGGEVGAEAGMGAAADAMIRSGLLRTEAVEAMLHLMNIAMDLVGGVRVRVS